MVKEHPPKSIFAKDVLKMASAPFCTHALGLLLMPVITRLYVPDAYGTFELFSSIVMPVAVLVGLGYISSIVLPKRDGVAANMLCISFIFTVLITLLSILFIWFGSEFLLNWLKAPELKAYLWLIPVTVFAHGFSLSFRTWNVRNKRFSRIAASIVTNSVTNKGVLIGAGFSGFATSGSLIIGRIAGSLTMSCVLVGRFWQESGQLFKRSIRWSYLVYGIKRYRKFPMYNLWTEVLGRLSVTVTIFLFSFYFSKTIIGYYGLGLAVLSMPMNLIATSIGEVFYQKAARVRDESASSFSLLVAKLSKQMIVLGMLPFMVLAIIGGSVFAFVFGANWEEAGVYAQILSFKMFITFVMAPVTGLANILEKQEVLFVFYIVAIIISGISIVIGGLLNNIYVALGMFSLLNGLALFGFGLLMFRLAGIPLSKIFSILLKCFVSCVPIVVVIALAKLYLRSSSLLLIIISIIGCMIYYGKLLKEDKDLRSIITMILKKEKPAERY